VVALRAVLAEGLAAVPREVLLGPGRRAAPLLGASPAASAASGGLGAAAGCRRWLAVSLLVKAILQHKTPSVKKYIIKP